ncbi:MAG: PorT family protein [Prolixibacteraceae bacterium]|nr:PorT family protein [Prolixibacteraceae bacterium]
MKRFCIIFTVLLLTMSSRGESPFNIGVKYGVNTSTMVTNFESIIEYPVNEEDISGYHVGAFGRLNIGRVYVQPEIYFNKKGGDILPISIENSMYPSFSFDYETLDVPLLLGIKLVNRNLLKLRLNAGPVFSFVTANNFYSEVSDFNINSFSSNYMAVQFGAGVDVWFLTLDARVEQSANIIEDSSSYEAKNRMYFLSLGIKLF